ncbi:MAG: 30S ribosomal protein S12 methylthiotransferase RimO [Eubacteriales bacterium]|nr:30S ribosomal protein S12 methylthiotransferase RimO [Eubacteriales bacterium]
MNLYIETLGCPKNFNDSEGIAGIWENAGMRVTEDIHDADVILVNTCGFINDAKIESINTVFDMISFRDRQILVVAGCLTQRYAEELAEEIPEIDIFVGVNDYEKLPEIIKKYRMDSQIGENCAHSRVYRSSAPCEFEELSARKIKDNPYSATLRIAEGCNNCCAYCVIPQIRGGYRSRSMENIINEAEKLADAGTRELILIAQDVTEYGRDIYGELKLPELLKKLCCIGGDKPDEGFRWIRLMYCYEDKITDELIEVMAAEKRIANYIDIPLQHISDNVLTGMGRRSTSESIRNTIRKLRHAIPDIHIRTTFITGFPGETQADFDILYDFVRKTRFERLGVFAYSQEEGTPAGDREDQIPEETRIQRSDSIMRMQMEISKELNEKKIAEVFDVIVDEIDEEGAYLGRTMYDAPEIDNTVIFSSYEILNPGDFVRVQIMDAFDYDLVGVQVK